MYDNDSLRDELETILEAVERIPFRFSSIRSPEDFSHTQEGMEHLDSICMILIAVGEAFKKIDRRTEGRLLSRYPQVDWSGVKGIRDVIAHEYFDLDAEEVYDICKRDIPVLIETVRKMIKDLG